MLKHLAILATAAVVIALPFLFQRTPEAGAWREGDPELVIVTPHNEAIRYEFERGFARWHAERFGRPVKIDWRAIGGTAEIARFLNAQYLASARAWRAGQGRPWSAALGEAMMDRKLDTNRPPSAEALALWRAFRSTDDPGQFTARIDLFFGGGEFDHARAFQEGLTVAPWPADQPPAGLLADERGDVLIPDKTAGETWRTATYFGNALGTFGICYNLDRLRDLGIERAPERWADLADPAFYHQLGVADPTKSGSIAKAFELIVHQQCYDAVRAAGFADEDAVRFEGLIKRANLQAGDVPPSVPPSYQEAVARGWANGLRLVQQIGANARYFTDSGSKVPIDVSAGAAAAGIAIDFYARFQAEATRAPDGVERMRFITPDGGSGASCDPISLLRGAEHRETAVRFIQFVLSEDGQRLWTYRAGAPGGPEKFSLRRLPIRRDFYPSDVPAFAAAQARHRAYTADDLADPRIDAYAVARRFHYYSRWTGQHFGIHRDLIRAMCMDSAAELQTAWRAILDHGGPARQPAAMALMQRLPDRPEPVTWTTALSVGSRFDRMDYMREWTTFFRNSYRAAAAAVLDGGQGSGVGDWRLGPQTADHQPPATLDARRSERGS